MIFPMLPLKFSTNLTSLNPNQDRLAMVVDMTIAQDASSSIFLNSSGLTNVKTRFKDIPGKARRRDVQELPNPSEDILQRCPHRISQYHRKT
jgi:hypothetical protein